MADQIGFKPTMVNPSGLSALIRNLGRDCTPDQYIREFVKNSIEACQRTGLSGRQIVLDYNHGIANKSGLYKLTFIDNGDGMSLDQMNNLLNSLSASGSTANEHANYGVGAKISSLTRNHFGVHYESWKEGAGHAILIRYNSKFDVFGMQGYPDAEGKVFYARKLVDANKPAIVDQHGTCVTLFGMYLEQDTMLPPDGMGSNPDTWLIDYLNRRFFSLPAGVEILVRVGYAQDKTNPTLNYLTRATGFKTIADEQSQSSGVMALPGAKAHWWILKPGATIAGQSALLNQGEIFDVSDSRSSRLAHFGILVGRNRIIILIEPEDAVQNTARTNLVRTDGSWIDWSGWQDEFRKNMPVEISTFIDSLLTETTQISHRQAITRRLSILKELFLLSGYLQLKAAFRKPAAPPPPSAVEDVASALDLADSGPSSPELPVPQEDAQPERNEEGDLSEEDSLFPNVEWTNEDRSPQLVGRAAEYSELTNTVLANRDFKGFEDLVQFFTAKYADTTQVSETISSSVNEAIEQALMECVAGALSLRGQAHWGEHHISQALSPEALTTAVMQRYWMVSYVDQVIRNQLAQQR